MLTARCAQHKAKLKYWQKQCELLQIDLAEVQQEETQLSTDDAADGGKSIDGTRGE